MSLLRQEFDAVKGMIQALADTQSDHTRDLAVLRSDASELKSDMTEMKSDMTEMKFRFVEMQLGINTIHGMLTRLVERPDGETGS